MSNIIAALIDLEYDIVELDDEEEILECAYFNFYR